MANRKCHHGVMLSRSRVEGFSHTQWTLRSQEGRHFRNPSNDDWTTLLLSHTPYFPRYLYSTAWNCLAVAELKQSIYDFSRTRDAPALLVCFKRLTGEARFACHPVPVLGRLCLHPKPSSVSPCVQGCLSPCLSCREQPCDVCAQLLLPQSCCLGTRSPSICYCSRGQCGGTGHSPERVLLQSLASASQRSWLGGTEAYIKCFQPKCCE